MTIYSSGKNYLYRLSNIKCIIQYACEKIYKVVGRASIMGLFGIGEVGDRANEGQDVWMSGAGFAVESLAGIGARDCSWEVDD